MIMVMMKIFNREYSYNEKDKVEVLQKEAQKLYDEATLNLDFNDVKCPRCHATGDYKVHGYYTRSLYYNYRRISVRILRVICNACKRTHAILFLDFVPWYRLISYHCKSLQEKNFIDDVIEDEILHRLKRRYLFFQNLCQIGLIDVKSDVDIITDEAFSAFNKAFLQIHRGWLALKYT